MIARYDLSHRHATFDFFVWLTHVRTLGAKEIVFGTKDVSTRKWPEVDVRKRYQSIVKPGPWLACLPSREGDDGEDVGTHKLQALSEFTDIPRLTTLLPARHERYTVTLRRNTHDPGRNSDEALWRRFAQEIGAYVIEDYATQPIWLYDRMALYAGAEMNFGVVNGPMGLLYLTPYPMQMWNCAQSEYAWQQHGIRKGKQLPWMLPHQRLVWEKPTLKALLNSL